MTGYRCLACGARQHAGFAKLTCPDCGGNLDITYDHAAAARALGGEFPPGDDLFRYAALLPLRSPPRPFPLRVGQTPLYPAPRLGRTVGLDDLWVKDDTLLPSGSLKDRAGAVALCRALETGAGVVATASTGNAGASLACLSAALGVRCVIFVPQSVPPAKLAQLLVFGAAVLAVRGSYDDACDLCLAACEAFGWLNRSTGHNPFTREGKKTCSYEIWEALGGEVPDWVAVSVGDGNILSGLWKGWDDLRRLGWIDRTPRMLCVQSQASDAVARAVRGLPASPDWSRVAVGPVRAATVADSIAVDRPRDGLAAVRAVAESGGAAVAVPDAEILAAIPEMARLAGVFAEPAAAAAWAGIRAQSRAGRIGPGERVVCVVTGSGLKDIARAGGAAGSPVVIDPTLDAVREAVAGPPAPRARRRS